MSRMSKLEKARKTIGKDTLEELEALDKNGLRQRIAQSNESMREAEDALEANPAYQKAKADLKDLSAGKRDVNKRQKAIIRVALSLL